MSKGTVLSKNNKVFLSGTVESEPVFSHELFGERFYDLTMRVMRLSEQSDIVPLTMSERLIKEAGIETGKKIAVSGQFRSYNKIIESKSKLMLTVFVHEMGMYSDENPNAVELTGFVCKPPVYRTTPFNREICDLLIAVNRSYNKSDYIPCIAWGRNARFIKNVDVGQKIMVFGRIQSREYIKKLSDEACETRVAYELSINKIDLIDDDDEA